MFAQLTDRMSAAVRRLRGISHLSEENMAEALKEVRTALLGADVHFKVARDFVERVQATALGQEVIKTVTPGQQLVKIIHDELVVMLGEGSAEFPTRRPLRVMLVGLHGSGKTTTAVKLAKYLAKKTSAKPALVACDVYRPAAIDQLAFLAKSENLPVYANRNTKDVPMIGAEALRFAQNEHADLVIFDTAGRLQIDEDLIEELKRLAKVIEPDITLLVADSALGQQAVDVAKHFHEAVGLGGIILTKLDGDTRGGAAVSMKAVTGVPILFMGLGEKLDQFEAFHPDRMAQRILGMGDVVSLVEKAQESIDEAEAEKLAKKLESEDFTLEDMLAQLQQMKKLGPLGNLVKMLPGMHGMEIGEEHTNQLKRTEAIIQSMTPQERRNPLILSGSRRLRICKGSGVQVKDLNALLKQFNQMRQMMRKMKGSKGKTFMKKMAAMEQMGGGMDDMAALTKMARKTPGPWGR